MRKHNPDNELAKREYLAWLRNAETREEATLDAAAAAIHGFEAFNRYRPFKLFRSEQAVSYKAHLAEQVHPRTGKPLTKATLRARLMALRAFFEWLSREPGYKKTVAFNDASYFNPSANDTRIAAASREQPAPSLEQVIHVLETMPTGTVTERRDRAVVAFAIATGARDSAIASMLLKDVDLVAGRVFQDARHVKTKRAKTFYSGFFPVGPLPRAIIGEWISELRCDHLFGPDEPIFPATRLGLNGDGWFAPDGLERTPWTTAAPIRAIFKRAFEAAGLPYANPHSLRRTLMRLAYDLGLSIRDMKAWSQNLGHESVMTSVTSYGGLSVHDQLAAIRSLHNRSRSGGESPADLAARLFAALSTQIASAPA